MSAKNGLPSWTSSRAAAIALTFTMALTLGILIGRYGSSLIAASKNLITQGTTRSAELENSAHSRQDVVDTYYRKREGPPAGRTGKSIDSSVLPLLMTEVPLGGSGTFADTGIIGGALTIVEGTLFVMDGLGHISEFKNGALHSMNYGVFPDGLDDLVKSSGKAVGLNVIKALYITYDTERGMIFVSLQKFDPVSARPRFNISSISIDKVTLEKMGDWRTVFETDDIPVPISSLSQDAQANGGKMIVVGNTLYFSIGDYNVGPPKAESDMRAQDSASSFGKIYEYDLLTGRTKVKSIGHRNPSGLAFTKAGKLIATEHGPQGGDELNIVIDGMNYGWPYKTYGTDYGKFDWPIGFEAPHVGFVDPVYAWVPSVAISTIIQISDFHERWNGDLMVGSLKGQTLFRIRMTKDRVIYAEPIWIGHRIRDMVEMPDRIVLMTDDPGLVFIGVDNQRLRENIKGESLDAKSALALAKCVYCHHFGETNPTHVAPTLSNVLGRPIASDSFGGYSAGLRNVQGKWDKESLRRFLANPNEFAPGSNMPDLRLSPQEINAAVSELVGRAAGSAGGASHPAR